MAAIHKDIISISNISHFIIPFTADLVEFTGCVIPIKDYHFELNSALLDLVMGKDESLVDLDRIIEKVNTLKVKYSSSTVICCNMDPSTGRTWFKNSIKMRVPYVPGTPLQIVKGIVKWLINAPITVSIESPAMTQMLREAKLNIYGIICRLSTEDGVIYADQKLRYTKELDPEIKVDKNAHVLNGEDLKKLLNCGNTITLLTKLNIDKSFSTKLNIEHQEIVSIFELVLQGQSNNQVKLASIPKSAFVKSAEHFYEFAKRGLISVNSGFVSKSDLNNYNPVYLKIQVPDFVSIELTAKAMERLDLSSQDWLLLAKDHLNKTLNYVIYNSTVWSSKSDILIEELNKLIQENLITQYSITNSLS